jgi:hypothetical protein
MQILDKPIDRAIGGILGPAVERVRWLETLPAFRDALLGASVGLEEKLISLCRGAISRENLANLPEILEDFRIQEGIFARCFDRVMVETALSCSRSRWNWSLEYIHRVSPIPSERPSKCPSCGGFACDFGLVDRVYPRLSRSLRVCGYCGVVSDLPRDGWKGGAVLRTEVVSASEFTGRVEVSNESIRHQTLIIGVAVREAGEMQPHSRTIGEVSLGPGESSSFEFALYPVKMMSKLMQTWAFVACEGALGLIGQIVLFGGTTAVGQGQI